jgi:hypothetical protein
MGSVYKAQCETFKVARELAGNFSNVSSINDNVAQQIKLKRVYQNENTRLKTSTDSST